MRTKNSRVNISNLCAEIASRLPRLDEFTKKLCHTQLVITSGNDGEHQADSMHYRDRAIDIRSWYVLPWKRNEYMNGLCEIFPYDKFDVIDESDHYHIEYDPHGRN